MKKKRLPTKKEMKEMVDKIQHQYDILHQVRCKTRTDTNKAKSEKKLKNWKDPKFRKRVARSKRKIHDQFVEKSREAALKRDQSSYRTKEHRELKARLAREQHRRAREAAKKGEGQMHVNSTVIKLEKRINDNHGVVTFAELEKLEKLEKQREKLLGI